MRPLIDITRMSLEILTQMKAHFNTLKHVLHAVRTLYIYIYILSPYRAVNTHRLGYKNHSVNVV